MAHKCYKVLSFKVANYLDCWEIEIRLKFFLFSQWFVLDTGADIGVFRESQGRSRRPPAILYIPISWNLSLGTEKLK